MIRADIAIAQQDPITGNKKTQNITNVNPEATNEQLYQFGALINTLTNRSFVGVTKITKEELING